MMDRRNFLSMASLATTAASIGTFAGTDLAFGRTTGGKTFVKVFMRGGADGLHLFPMVDDPHYEAFRPDLAMPRDVALDLKYGRGTKRRMNPNLEPLLEIWEEGRMMISPATGFPENNRSHFVAQRWIGQASTNDDLDGYLNRYLKISGNDEMLGGAVLGKSSMSRELQGAKNIAAVPSAGEFGLTNRHFCSDRGCTENQLLEELSNILDSNASGDSYLSQIDRTGGLMVDSIERINKAAAAYDEAPLAGRTYSDSRLGQGLKLVSQLLNDGVPLEVAAVDWNMSWDMHGDQLPNNNSNDRFTDQSFDRNADMRAGAEDFITFYRDLKARGLLDDVLVLVCTEFGRTIQQNGSFGTDHGWGGAWFAFGGGVQRRIAVDMDALPDPSDFSNGQLIGEARYVPYKMQYQDIVAEVLVRHLGLPPGLVGDVLPGWSWTDHSFLRT